MSSTGCIGVDGAPTPARGAAGALVLIFMLGCAPAALAQSDQSAPGKAQVIEKVERGAFAIMEAGAHYLIAPDTSTDYGLGFGAGLYVGWDIISILNVAIGLNAIMAGGSDEVDGALISRDRLYLTPSLRIQMAILTTERDFFWLRGEGGLGILESADDLTEGGSGVGPSFTGAIGYEYFSTLRHFSLGLQAGLTTFLEPDLALSVFLTPMLKYSF